MSALTENLPASSARITNERMVVGKVNPCTSVTSPLIVAWLPSTLRHVTRPLMTWFGSALGFVNDALPCAPVPLKLLWALKLNLPVDERLAAELPMPQPLVDAPVTLSTASSAGWSSRHWG